MNLNPLRKVKINVARSTAEAKAPNNEPVSDPIKTVPVRQPEPAPVKAEKVKVKEKKKAIPLFLRLPAQEQILFAKRLSILLKAGVPILGALQMFKKQTKSSHTMYIMGELVANVENGTFLSVGMAQFKKIFGEFAVNIVRVGEVSGTLNENLNYLAEELKKKQELRRKVISALVYPIFIVFATVGVVILLTAYVFPKIMPIFQSFKFDLPWTTKTLIFVSNAFIHYGAYILLGLILLVVGFILLLRNYKFHFWIQRTILRLPLIGPLLQSYNIANFTRTLGLLLKSDVRIVEGLHIAANTSGNLPYKKEFEAMADNATKGEKISVYMEKNPKMFPPVLSQMISVGETAGGLSHSLMFLAEMYEEEMNNLTKNLSTSIEPILMIFMGLLVGFIAMSIITPIYGVTQNIHP